MDYLQHHNQIMWISCLNTLKHHRITFTSFVATQRDIRRITPTSKQQPTCMYSMDRSYYTTGFVVRDRQSVGVWEQIEAGGGGIYECFIKKSFSMLRLQQVYWRCLCKPVSIPSPEKRLMAGTDFLVEYIISPIGVSHHSQWAMTHLFILARFSTYRR